MADKSIFGAFNRLIESTIKNGDVGSADKRFYIPSGSFTPTSAIIGSDISSFTGADSLQISTVYACVSKISDTIASMDGVVEKKGSNGSITPVHNHPISYLICDEPNELMGAFEFKSMIISDMLLYGVGYGYIDRKANKIYWLPASDVTYVLDKTTGDKFFHYPGAPTPVPSYDMLELRAFRGLSPTRTQIKTLNTAKSLMDFGNKFFENGGMLGGILTTKEPLDEGQMLEITKFWKERYAGSENAHKVAILGGGFTYQPLSVPLDQLQYIDSKKYSAEEICRVYQMPPAMVGMEGNSSYNNYEQQALQYMQGCIAPRVKAFEIEISRKLLSEDRSLSFRFDVESMMRADFMTKAEYYTRMLNNGSLSINEVRKKEGLSNIESGDIHFTQVNQIPLTLAERYGESIVSSNDKPKESKVDDQAKMEGLKPEQESNNNKENG